MQKKFPHRSQLHKIPVTKTALPKQTPALRLQTEFTAPLPIPVLLLQQRVPNLELSSLPAVLPIRYPGVHRPHLQPMPPKHNLPIFNLHLIRHVLIIQRYHEMC